MVVQDGVEVICERVVVVAGGGRAGATVAAAVVADAAKSGVEQRGRLILPHATGEAPGMDEDDRGAAARVATEEGFAVRSGGELAVASGRAGQVSEQVFGVRVGHVQNLEGRDSAGDYLPGEFH